MGLARLFGTENRAIQYVATDTVSGAVETFTILDRNPLAPQWASATYRGVMSIPAAWRAANLIADLLGGLPWHAYRERAGAAPGRIPAPLLEQPCPPDTRVTTFSALALDLLLHGNAIAIFTARNADGYPTALLPVPADQVGVRRAGRDEVYAPGEVLYEVGERVFTSADVLHIKGPSAPGALRGMGVLEQHLDTWELSVAQTKEARSVSQHGVPTGVIKTTNEGATAESLREMKKGWLESQRERTVAVLNASAEFEPLSWDPSQTQLLEARQFSVEDIARIFQLDPSWLGAAQTSRVYSNIEQEAVNLVKFSLGGHLSRFEQALSLAFPRGTTVRANLDALLRADTLTRYQAHQIGLQAGFLKPSEARELENRAPIPGQDTKWASRQYGSVPEAQGPMKPVIENGENADD